VITGAPVSGERVTSHCWSASKPIHSLRGRGARQRRACQFTATRTRVGSPGATTSTDVSVWISSKNRLITPGNRLPPSYQSRNSSRLRSTASGRWKASA
jgi:hypothetical protein